MLPSTCALSASLGDSAGDATSSAHDVFALVSSAAGAVVGASEFFGGCEMRSAREPEGLGSEPGVDISRLVNVDESLFRWALFVTGSLPSPSKWGGGEVRGALNPEFAIVAGNKIDGEAGMSKRDAQ